MADVVKIATRDAYGKALAELGQEKSDLIVFDADLAGATKTSVFQKAFPDRHFDFGIAEGNMMAAAAGASTMGLVPFASSFAMFAAGRAFEQVRNSIGYPHLNVKIGATHGGISVGEDGASHQCCEDFALMRSIPGMTVICPADAEEAKQAVYAAYEMEGPVYLRFGRLAVPVFHSDDYKFEIGKGEVVREGSDVAIIANGLLVYEAIQAGELLAEAGINAIYEISKPEDLLAWVKDGSNWSGEDLVMLLDDIDCAGVITSSNWSLKDFSGTFDGNNKTIDNFKIQAMTAD